MIQFQAAAVAKAEAEKKKGPETRKDRRARHRAVAAGGTGQEEGGPR